VPLGVLTEIVEPDGNPGNIAAAPETSACVSSGVNGILAACFARARVARSELWISATIRRCASSASAASGASGGRFGIQRVWGSAATAAGPAAVGIVGPMNSAGAATSGLGASSGRMPPPIW
jgi:hypothetical protein